MPALRPRSKTALSSVSSSSFPALLAPRLTPSRQDHAHLPSAFRERTPKWLQRGCCLRGHRVLLLLNPVEPAFSFSVKRGPAVSLGNPNAARVSRRSFNGPIPHMSASFPLAPLERQ